MKKQLREQAQKAIREMKDNNELNGYTWTVTTDGLKWSYLDTEFVIIWNEESKMLKAYDKNNLQLSLAIIWVEAEEEFADCDTLEEAYYKITKMLIKTANHLY